MVDWAGALESLAMIQPTLDQAFWRGRRVLLTGHTGFKGSWLAMWLAKMGAHVTGMALRPDTSPSLFVLAGVERLLAASHFADIRDPALTAAIVREAQPEIVLHLAAQPLVRQSYAQPVATFATNVMGTVHVLDALRGVDTARVALMVTTDKVYANREWQWPYREDDVLGGHDPYSASKAASEIVIESYRKSFLGTQGVRVASARAGNVVGGGDWSEDRLLPDAVRAWQAGRPLCLRRPDSVRPWQHLLEPLFGYLLLAERLWSDSAPAGAYNFGPASSESANVLEVASFASEAWGSGAKIIQSDEPVGPYEAGSLSLEVARARQLLGFRGRWSTGEAVGRAIRWYARQQAGEDARALCEADIADYQRSA